MKLFQIIDNSFVGRIVEKRMALLAATDPERIYVENIRSFYSVKFAVAKTFCEMAVKEHLFNKCYGIECPNEGRIIDYFNSVEQIPNIIECENCALLEREKYTFSRGEIKVVEFYQLRGLKNVRT